jgi:Tfp pilus assembly major pilin PilA
MSRNRQAGFALIEAVLIVAFLAALGGVSYVVVKHRSTATTATTANTATVTPASATVPAAPDVKTTKDLTQAEQTLDSTNIDAGASDTSQLDAQVNDF